MDPYLWKRLWRRPWLSLCSLLISAAMCVMVSYISQYRQEQVQKLEEAASTYDIYCVVTDIKGTQSTNLRIGEDVLDFVQAADSVLTPYIRDLRVTKEFKYSSAELNVDTSEMLGVDITSLIGVNSPHCADELDPERLAEVTYLTDSFYEQSEYVCIVSEACYLELEDDVLQLNVTDPYINPRKTPDLGKGTVEMKVAGYYAGKGTVIYMPFPAAMKLAEEISQQRSCDSISFLAADNQELEILSRLALRKFAAVDPQAPLWEADKLALTVRDAQYRSAVAVFEQNIRRADYLVPVLLLLGLGVGFLVSFLSTRNETKIYALMRTLGMNSRKLFLSVLREQLVLPILATAAVAAVFRAWFPVGIYLLCHLTGCAVCVARTAKASPNEILRKQE